MVKVPVGYKLPRWLVDWLRGQEEPAAQLIEDALRWRHKLNPPIVLADVYPSWVCTPCGQRYGRRARREHISTYHEGTCGVCGQAAMVTEPRDFGDLKPEWRQHGNGGAA